MQQNKKDSCIICLSDTGDISTKHTYLACKCKVPVHTHCWMQYVKAKNGTLECPMCHVITLRNPILPASITGLAKEVPVQIQQSREDRDKCVARTLCCCLLSWLGTITIGSLLA